MVKCLPEQSLKGSLYGDLMGVAQVFEGEPETPVEANIHRDSSITGHSSSLAFLTQQYQAGH